MHPFDPAYYTPNPRLAPHINDQGGASAHEGPLGAARLGEDLPTPLRAGTPGAAVRNLEDGNRGPPSRPPAAAGRRKRPPPFDPPTPDRFTSRPCTTPPPPPPKVSERIRKMYKVQRSFDDDRPLVPLNEKELEWQIEQRALQLQREGVMRLHGEGQDYNGTSEDGYGTKERPSSLGLHLATDMGLAVGRSDGEAEKQPNPESFTTVPALHQSVMAKTSRVQEWVQGHPVRTERSAALQPSSSNADFDARSQPHAYPPQPNPVTPAFGEDASYANVGAHRKPYRINTAALIPDTPQNPRSSTPEDMQLDASDHEHEYLGRQPHKDVDVKGKGPAIPEESISDEDFSHQLDNDTLGESDSDHTPRGDGQDMDTENNHTPSEPESLHSAVHIRAEARARYDDRELELYEICQKMYRGMGEVMEQSCLQTQEMKLLMSLMGSHAQVHGSCERKPKPKADASEEELISMDLDSDDEAQRGARASRPKRKPLSVTDFHAAVREHAHDLLDWAPSSEQPFPRVPNHHSNYMIKFKNGENKGCTLECFQVDVSETPGSAWNRSAADVFAEDFTTYWKGPESWMEVREQFISWLGGHRKTYLAWTHDSSDAAQNLRLANKARQTRKRNLWARRVEACRSHPDMWKHAAMVDSLGADGMSLDEDMGNGTYRIRPRLWRHPNLTPFLRALDRIYHDLMTNGAGTSRRGNTPHIRVPPPPSQNPPQASTSAAGPSTAAAQSVAIAPDANALRGTTPGLPRTLYNPAWLESLTKVQMHRLDLQNRDYYFDLPSQLF
ncbi:hypothetical protein BOTBODRAFT_49543 [Botryobasidium botryosum FD-172 SS1]|uniref:Uncharacterized protein n=1 Tax=Botryobasidium botryosum (strain FD-172 SS1) TaxID=930990 RepID=A0A067LV50_BOTB1|nr:hypothetical protein BOTBODRAFT_49543 [Botryobasidium botryosum FD-172 SS1]